MLSLSWKQLFWIFASINLLLSGVIIGFVIGSPHYFANSPSPTVPANEPAENKPAPVPTFVTDNTIERSGIQATFERTDDDHRILDRAGHDPLIIQNESEDLLLVASHSTKHALYRSNVTSPSNWAKQDGHYITGPYENAFDSVVYVDGRYIAYGNNRIYTATPKQTALDNWTKQTTNEFNDLGAYYDGERVHVYYEVGHRAKYSGKAIGHATSPNGITNWTRYPPVWTAPEGWGVGDFEVEVVNDTVLLFGDYAKHHPKYEVRVWANDNFYTNFTQLETPAIEPRAENSSYEDDYGVQDVSIAHVDRDKYLMIANGHDHTDMGPALHYYMGTISVNQSSDAKKGGADLKTK